MYSLSSVEFEKAVYNRVCKICFTWKSKIFLQCNLWILIYLIHIMYEKNMCYICIYVHTYTYTYILYVKHTLKIT